MLYKIISFTVIAGLCVTLSINSTVAAAGQLIVNNSAEQKTNNLPTNWNTNKWGTLDARFTAITPGHDGNTALRTEVTNYISGDAKWYHNYVNVEPATDYDFSDFYKSNVATHVTVDVLTTNNTHEYYWLGSPVASSGAYTQFKAKFKTPANAKSLSVFHVISTNGWLETDSYSLLKAGTVNEPTPETPSSTPAPAGWNNNSWGSLSASFKSYTLSQFTTPILETKVGNYQNGDAKWYKSHQSVKPQTTYTISDQYKSDVANNVTVEVVTTDGTHKYYWLGSPAASPAQFTTFSAEFITPLNAKSMTVYHLLNSNGTLSITNQVLKEKTAAPTPTEPQPSNSFQRPLVSIEFDDGWSNAYNLGFPVVEEFGFHATQYVITQTPGWNGYMSNQDIINLSQRGHDIGSHTVTHPSLPTLTSSQIDNELAQSQNYLQNLLNKPVNMFVTPYCESNSSVTSIAKKYYSMLRNCDPEINTKSNFDAYNIRSHIVLKNTTNTEIQNWINDAKATNGWLVLVYHEVTPATTNDWTITPEGLRSQLQLVKNSGLTVKKTADALAEIQSQL